MPERTAFSLVTLITVKWPLIPDEEKRLGLSCLTRVRITEFGHRFPFLLLCESSIHLNQYGEHQ